MISHDGVELAWLGYATLRIAAAGTIVYVDPGRFGVLDRYDGGDGTVVCVSHDHHYDPDAIRTVAREDATIVRFEGIDTHRIDRDVERLVDLPYEMREVDAAADVAVGDAIVRTTAAYNHPDGPHVRPDGAPYHPEGIGCGFHVTLDGTSVYWPGDTDVLDGHEHLDVDVFCPPIGGTCTMDRTAAADLCVRMDSELVVPIHYDTVEDIETDAGAFVDELASRGVDARLDE